MNKCTYCGREGDWRTKAVGGYTVLECCTDCEREILAKQSPQEARLEKLVSQLELLLQTPTMETVKQIAEEHAAKEFKRRKTLISSMLNWELPALVKTISALPIAPETCNTVAIATATLQDALRNALEQLQSPNNG